MKLLSQIKKNKKRIYGIGAPSRASTFINYAGIDDGIIDCVLEVSSSHKLNKYMQEQKFLFLTRKTLFGSARVCDTFVLAYIRGTYKDS